MWDATMDGETQPDFSVAILAGGQSRRMGQNKALLDVAGTVLLQRVINAVQTLTDDLFLVTDSAKRYQKFGLRMVGDAIPGKAALGGIYSAILAAHHEWIFLLACDMPLLDGQVIAFLAGYRAGVDIVTPFVEAQPETLHTFYHKNCLPFIKARLQADQLRVIDFFAEVAVRYVDRTDLVGQTTDFSFLTNLNTPEELAVIRQALAPAERFDFAVRQG
jgi:molybdopterin-guanine dinucleotide biosynthesis protein A